MVYIIKIKALIDELGLLNVTLYLFDRVIRFISKNKFRFIRYFIFSQPVSDTRLLPERRGRNIQVTEVLLGDPIIENFPIPIEVIEARYAQGAQCFVATKKGDFLGYIWIVFHKYTEDEVRVVYQLNDKSLVWDFDVYIAPKHRFSFAFSKLWDEVYAYLRKKGAKHSLSRISAFNSSSLKSHQSLAATPLFYVNFLIVGDFQLAFLNFPPYFHLSWSFSPLVLKIRK